MEQLNLGNLRSMPLERLVSDALGELERLGYSRRSRNRYRAVWQHLIEYSDQNKLGDKFSRDLAVRLLGGHRVGEDMETPGQEWRKHIVWGLALLADLAEKGRIASPILRQFTRSHPGGRMRISLTGSVPCNSSEGHRS
jgi:hypothetical protein